MEKESFLSEVLSAIDERLYSSSRQLHTGEIERDNELRKSVASLSADDVCNYIVKSLQEIQPALDKDKFKDFPVMWQKIQEICSIHSFAGAEDLLRHAVGYGMVWYQREYDSLGNISIDSYLGTRWNSNTFLMYLLFQDIKNGESIKNPTKKDLKKNAFARQFIK